MTLPDGTPGIAKRVVPGGDWLGRVAGGRAITAELWQAGVLQRLPAAIETGIVAVEPEGDGWRILMRDLSAALLPAEGPISRARHREVMAAAAALHAAFRGERFDGAITLERHLAISSPAIAEAERDGSDVIPKQLETAWEAFAEAADDDVAQAVLANLADPAPLARALRAGGTTLVHGDLRDDNLGFVDGRVVLLDWDIAGEGTPALEVAWYLCHDAWRTRGHARRAARGLPGRRGRRGERARPRPRAHRRPAALRLDLRPQRGHPPRPGRARVGPRGARLVGAARARRARAHRRGGVMRAAVLHGPDDLRVEEVDEPAGEVLVEVRAATACGTDRKMLRHGHRILGDYPARFGHETAGVRVDTGERVLVGDSVACGACAPCRAGRAAICRAPTWVLGGFAERIAAPPGALHAIPDGLDFAGAAMAEPLSACVHAMARGTDATDVAVLGGGTIGLMLARLLVLDGRDVLVCDRHPERRAQAQAFGARAADALGEHDLVFEAVGRVEAWEQAVAATRPGGTAVLVGGCPAGTTVAASPPRRCTTTRSTCAAPFTTRARRSIARWRCWPPATSTGRRSRATSSAWRTWRARCRRPSAGEARKLVVEPSR